MTQQPAAGERPATEAIDRLYLELSQFTRATTGREMELMKKAEDLRDTCCKMVDELAALRKQLSDQARDISMLNAEAEMWQQRAEIAEREVVRVNERLVAELSTRTQQRDDQDQLRGEFAKRCVEAEVEIDRLKEVLSDDFGFGSTVASNELSNWLPQPAEAEQLEGGG